jgi:hypothetical protein
MADPNCTSQINHIKNFNSWYSAPQTGQLALLNGLLPTGINGVDTPHDTSLRPTLNSRETDLISHLKCLQAEITRLTSGSSTVSDLYDQKALLQNEIKVKSDALRIAKDRAALLKNPEQNTTIYESWFPLQRPLRSTTLLILTVFSLFFMSVFLGLVMKQLGFSVDISLLVKVPGALSSIGSISRFLTPLTLGLGASLLVCIGAIIYLVSKKG